MRHATWDTKLPKIVGSPTSIRDKATSQYISGAILTLQAGLLAKL